MSYNDSRYFEAWKGGPMGKQMESAWTNRDEFESNKKAIEQIATKYGVQYESYLSDISGDLEADNTEFSVETENGYIGAYWDEDRFYFCDYDSEGESGPELDHPYTLPEFEYWFATLLGRGPAFLRRQIALLANELRRRGVPPSNAWKIAHEVCKTSESHTAKAWLDWSEIVIQFTKQDGGEVWKRSRLHTFERKGSAVCFWSETDNAYRSFNRDRLIQIRVADDSQTQFITLAA